MNPLVVQIESSTACNARCLYCPHRMLSRQPGSMSDVLFGKIIEEVRILGIKNVVLFLNGEPLLFPHLFEYLEKLREYGITTALFTNGTLLTTPIISKILSYKDVIKSIIFNIAGIDNATFKYIMNIDGDLVEKNIRDFLAYNKNQIRVEGHIPLCSYTKDFIPIWYDKWKNSFDFLTSVSMANWAGLIHDPLEMVENEKTHKRFCQRLRHLAILWDGRVCLCCMDSEGKVILGDANRQPLIEIYNSDLAIHYRQLHREERFSELTLCADCNNNIITDTEWNRVKESIPGG